LNHSAAHSCVADCVLASHWQHLPGQAAWLVCEARSSGERKCYFTNHPPNTPHRTLIRAIKACWTCEQTHRQVKDELGLDHYEGRSCLALHHHALLTMIAFTYLQHIRLTSALRARNKNRHPMHQVRHPSHHYRQYAALLSPRCVPSFAVGVLIAEPGKTCTTGQKLTKLS
jgi:hypothetical protein